MAQGTLPFKYEGQSRDTGMTALDGLPVYPDLAHVPRLSASVGEHLEARAGKQGWTDEQMVLSLILLRGCF